MSYHQIGVAVIIDVASAIDRKPKRKADITAQSIENRAIFTGENKGDAIVSTIDIIAGSANDDIGVIVLIDITRTGDTVTKLIARLSTIKNIERVTILAGEDIDPACVILPAGSPDYNIVPAIEVDIVGAIHPATKQVTVSLAGEGVEQ